MFPHTLGLSLLCWSHQFGGALDHVEVSIGTSVLFNHWGVLVELYCCWAYWFSQGSWFPLWKNGLLVGGRKLLNPPGVFLCIVFINCHDLVILIALSFIL